MIENTLLSFEGVSFRYLQGQDEVLRSFDLDIQVGSATAILGPNGVGKTTLLHIALGFLKPQSGKILIKGRPLNSYSRQEMGRLIGLVPQFEQSRFDYSLLEYVALGRAPYLKPLEMPGKEDIRISYEALEKVGLSPFASRSVALLSGGEKQLVLVARALAQQPGILLLDEATSHLDLRNKLRLIEVLKDLLIQGITIVFTTHEPEVVSVLATDLVLMRSGQVLENGSFENVFTSQNLTATYEVPVSVISVQGRKIAVWGY
ncbi:MAG: ABC transporter ATP-binding protein [Anaerolineales bacterium]|nr:ABC transporter ATP-binding protein [Anaerolineales bacterium]